MMRTTANPPAARMNSATATLNIVHLWGGGLNISSSSAGRRNIDCLLGCRVMAYTIQSILTLFRVIYHSQEKIESLKV